MKTFNTATGIPSRYLDRFDRECSQIATLRYSRHACRAILDDRYGKINSALLPRTFVASAWKLIEITVTDSGTIDKFVVRCPLDDTRDLVLVIMPDGLVKTLWINLASDNHATLDRSRLSH